MLPIPTPIANRIPLGDAHQKQKSGWRTYRVPGNRLPHHTTPRGTAGCTRRRGPANWNPAGSRDLSPETPQAAETIGAERASESVPKETLPGAPPRRATSVRCRRARRDAPPGSCLALHSRCSHRNRSMSLGARSEERSRISSGRRALPIPLAVAIVTKSTEASAATSRARASAASSPEPAESGAMAAITSAPLFRADCKASTVSRLIRSKRHAARTTRLPAARLSGTRSNNSPSGRIFERVFISSGPVRHDSESSRPPQSNPQRRRPAAAAIRRRDTQDHRAHIPS